MKSYRLIHELIDLVEKFEEESGNEELSIQDFAGFLVSRVAEPADTQVSTDVRFGDKENESQQLAYQLDNSIGRLVVYMSRYAKSYIKKALDGTPLQTAEDFTCLAILLTHTDLAKKDLISHNLQEKTSGTEVIRRLISAGLAKQINDEKDKRSKRISITNEGKELLYKVFEDMNYVGQIVTGDLTTTEKFTLNYLLQKLENFHYRIHQDKLVVTKEDMKSIEKFTLK
ncbi:winged helix-turn-helix transcriptional regulator [Inquilinus sp. KBS0705]|nr:winged helix-turn-helix transcriptional regulator [Inquilinus sp. KBS0705]